MVATMPVILELVHANLLNPISDHLTDVIMGGTVIVQREGAAATIIALFREKLSWKDLKSDPRSLTLKKLLQSKDIELRMTDLSPLLLTPGFCDMHFHWVQDDVRLMPKDDLLTWLKTYTWPYEEKFADVNYSRQRASAFAKELRQTGTTSGAVYASLHAHSADHALEMFQGDFVVGNVLMTMNSPSTLNHSIDEALQLITEQGKKWGRRYAPTPRFAPTTHPEVMMECGRLAKKHGQIMQTHLAETRDEIDYVLHLFRAMEDFRNVADYTSIYEQCGFLTNKTVMGHGIYLSDEELKMLARAQTMIAHCPTSNAPVSELGLGSGLFDWQRAEHFGVPWALGSDIGGGPYLSMIDVMNSFVLQNRRASKRASLTQAFYRATVPGNRYLGAKRGQFACGHVWEYNGRELSAQQVAKYLTATSAEEVLTDFWGQQHRQWDHFFTHQG